MFLRLSTYHDATNQAIGVDIYYKHERKHFDMSNFSAIRAVLIILIIFVGALSLFSLRNAVSVSIEQRRPHLTRLAFCVVFLVLLIVVLVFISEGTAIFR